MKKLTGSKPSCKWNQGARRRRDFAEWAELSERADARLEHHAAPARRRRRSFGHGRLLAGVARLPARTFAEPGLDLLLGHLPAFGLVVVGSVNRAPHGQDENRSER
jgi:hypothetical protein